MKLPRFMKVRGRTWRVRVVDDLKNDDGLSASGLCSDKLKLIEIELGMTDDQSFEVFIHEWLHAVWYECGIDDENVPSWIEHWFVGAVSKDMQLHADKWLKIFKDYIKTKK